jgi:hypothetical protein
MRDEFTYWMKSDVTVRSLVGAEVLDEMNNDNYTILSALIKDGRDGGLYWIWHEINAPLWAEGYAWRNLDGR